MRAAAAQDYVEYVTARLPELNRLALLLCGNEHRADDLVQQTITKLYVGWRRIRNVEHLDAYVRTMLTNTYLSERRTFWAKVQLFHRTPEAQVAAVSESGAVENRELLRVALSKVSRRQRSVIVLRYFCDLPVAEVAAILGCSEGNVKSHTHHGLKALRDLLHPTAVPSTGKG